MLLHDDRARDRDELAVPMFVERERGQHATAIELVAVETHDLRASGDPGDAVIERDALALRKHGQCRRVGWRERQVRTRERGRRAMRVARAPQEGAA